MKNTIMTKNGIFTIYYFPTHYNFEMLALDGYDNVNILSVQYSSDFYRVEDEQKIKNIFKDLEQEIIQIMKFYVNENIEFYKHFDFNPDYNLSSGCANLTPTEIDNNKLFHVYWDWFLKTELKVESLHYLSGLPNYRKLIA